MIRNQVNSHMITDVNTHLASGDAVFYFIKDDIRLIYLIKVTGIEMKLRIIIQIHIFRCYCFLELS